ncbi:MAG: hypothetical protein LC799_22410 [Actinobacteria bacterium]|nr:hypothetical protein [Actinomycetota bacterium]
MAMPVNRPGSLLTLDDWIALPEDNTSRYELQEGVLDEIRTLQRLGATIGEGHLRESAPEPGQFRANLRL